ncbi:alpha-glycosidase [Paenibacillus albiflavus]|uniref:Alpha-glycosidase n=1 Tax=Paenibacillus albiflavus TaxID=2545760 RepID=A0A4R4EA09_9BACL|nr:alpha-glycosidase [Paenibacillus albiflavus]TCZ74698.1 alpha-glycosidase [Paenibacillus albiflavus]
MELEAIYHRPKLNWSYARDERTVHVRVRTRKDDMKLVTLIVADKYVFESSKQEIPMRKLISDALFDYWQAETTPPYRRLCYSFKFTDGEETAWLTERGFQAATPVTNIGMFEYPFLNPADIFTPPAWVKDAIFYQIFPERFANGDPANDPANVLPWGGKPEWNSFFGGDLQGVMDHLDHLNELGVTAIYFTPVFEATTNHKYDTQNYLKVDKHFGDNALLKRLVDACHERGIRVLLDAVFNHAGGTFGPFLDAKAKGESSEYADWFHVKEWPLRVEDGVPTYDAFAFEPHMPKLNTENPSVKKYFLDVARYWIEEVGIDGWRLDVANEVDHRFWREFRDTVKATNPEAYILGEIWHDSMMWLQGDQFDAVMNYPFTNAVLDYFTKRLTDTEQFASEIGALIAAFPEQATISAFNILDSHDTPRLLTQCGGDHARMKLAALFQFTYPGVPCIYYGDEVGLEGGADPDCRKCMEWDPVKQDADLFRFYKELIELRKRHSTLRTGEFRFLHAESGDMRLAYERTNQEERLIVAINNSKRARKLVLKGCGSEWRDAWTDATVPSTGNRLELTLPAFGYRVLKADN